MKTLLLASAATIALTFSGNAAAQQAEQEASSFISQQITHLSVELYQSTKDSIADSLESWGSDLFDEVTEEADSSSEPSSEQQ